MIKSKRFSVLNVENRVFVDLPKVNYGAIDLIIDLSGCHKLSDEHARKDRVSRNWRPLNYQPIMLLEVGGRSIIP